MEPTSNEPKIGPVQENETMAKVNCHKENAADTGEPAFVNRLCPQLLDGSVHLEETKKGKRKENEYDKKENIQACIGRNAVENFRLHIADDMKWNARQNIDQEYKKTIQHTIANSTAAGFRTLGEKGNRNGDHGENAWCKQCN